MKAYNKKRKLKHTTKSKIVNNKPSCCWVKPTSIFINSGILRGVNLKLLPYEYWRRVEKKIKY